MMIMEKAAAEAEDVVSLCSVHAGPGLFGVDTREIREVLGAAVPQPVPLAPAYIAGVISYRGNVLTTVSLRALLEMEKRVGASCVLVLEDEEPGRQFGLMVDGVGSLITMTASELEANPNTLEARSAVIFDGVYKMQDGLIVRLDPRRLRPLQLARSGLFGAMKQDKTLEPK